MLQGVADYVKNIYFRAHDGVAVNLYAPSHLKWSERGTSLTLTQETDYPLGESVTLRIACTAPVEFALQLRIPPWVLEAPVLRVNSKPANFNERRGFAVVHRRWNDGDVVTVNLKQSFRTEAIDDLHPETVSLLRGPLVYVELNPAQGAAKMSRADALRPAEQAPGAFSSEAGSRTRLYVPFYFVRDEPYTMYAERS